MRQVPELCGTDKEWEKVVWVYGKSQECRNFCISKSSCVDPESRQSNCKCDVPGGDSMV
jgi:hypothetical protein